VQIIKIYRAKLIKQQILGNVTKLHSLKLFVKDDSVHHNTKTAKINKKKYYVAAYLTESQCTAK